MDPTLAPGWGAGLTVTRSGTGSAIIDTGITLPNKNGVVPTRELYVVVICSGQLPFYVSDAKGTPRIIFGSSVRSTGTCADSSTNGYRFKATAADARLRVVATPSTRWAIKVYALTKPPVVTVP
jgi:hypothetical protein